MNDSTTTLGEIGKTIREMIRHEDELLNQRLTALGQFEGLLFVAYSFAYKEDHDLLWIFMPLGALIALSVLRSTYLAGKATSRLAREWDNLQRARKAEGETAGWRPDVQGVRGSRHWDWIMPGYSLPGLFFLGWAGIALMHL